MVAVLSWANMGPRESKTCTGDIVKLNHDEIEIALEQASNQLGGDWRLPTLEELETLVCESCAPPKIKQNIFQIFLQKHIGQANQTFGIERCIGR